MSSTLGASPDQKVTVLSNEEHSLTTPVGDRLLNSDSRSADNEALAEKNAPGHTSEDDKQSEDAADEANYPTPLRRYLIILGLCLATLCMSIDNTIIGTALPKITDDFKSIDDVGWYGSAFLLTVCAFQLAFAKLYTFYSIKWMYLIALLIFEVGSVICGAAPNSNALIVGRAIAG
jgi:hypothetical protein